jgi:hypothetical protein
MAKLVFGMNQLLDGYVDYMAFAPGPRLFRHFIEHDLQCWLMPPARTATSLDPISLQAVNDRGIGTPYFRAKSTKTTLQTGSSFHEKSQRIAYSSCSNRHCPKCQGAAARTWLAEREADLLPVGYFHVVFTLPVEVADIAF